MYSDTDSDYYCSVNKQADAIQMIIIFVYTIHIVYSLCVYIWSRFTKFSMHASTKLYFFQSYISFS